MKCGGFERKYQGSPPMQLMAWINDVLRYDAFARIELVGKSQSCMVACAIRLRLSPEQQGAAEGADEGGTDSSDLWLRCV